MEGGRAALPTPLVVAVAAGLPMLVLAGAVAGRGFGAYVAVATLVGLAVLAYFAWYVDPAWILATALVLTMFNGNWEQLGLPGAVSPDRAVLFAGVVALLIRTPAARQRPPVRVGFVHWLLTAATLWAALSALVAGTLLDISGGFRLLDRFSVTAFVMFLIAPVAFRTVEQRAILLGGLVVSGLYLGLTALFQTINLDALVWPKYILDPNVGIHPNRARGPFVEAEANGLAMFICAVSAAIATQTWRHRSLRTLAWFVLALCMAGTLFSLSRAIWLGAIFGVAAAMLGFRELRRFFLPAVAGSLIAIGLAFALIPNLYENASARVESERPIWARQNTTAAAINIVEAKPLTGVGWDRFRDESGPYFELQDIPLTATDDVIHNVPLSNAAEIGLIGTGIWAIALVLAAFQALTARAGPELRPWKIGFVAIAVMWFVVLNLTPLNQVFPNIMLWTWAGILYVARQPEYVPALSPMRVDGDGDGRTSRQLAPLPALRPARS
jgi:putative inorganic carbon (HCO3(-)) transporter